MPTPLARFTTSAFSQQLRQARQAARLSQLALSLRSGVSQRHLSCLESGHAQPGREVVLQLSRGLELSLAAQGALLLSAGYSPPAPAPSYHSAEMAAVREAAQRLLQQHEPYPALLMDRAYDVMQTNAGFDRLLARIDPSGRLWQHTAGAGRPNLLKLSLHPDGLRPHVVDFRTYASAILVRAERAAAGFPALRTVLNELRADPLLDAIARAPSPLSAAQTGPAWMEHYHLAGQSLKLFSVQASIGVPMDAVAESVVLECYFPGDAAAKELLSG